MGARHNFCRPSFFKMMIGDFHKKLVRCWNVKVREEEDGGLSFRKGWPDFVEAHYVGHGDFVIIKYSGNSQFVVKLYGINGCEKLLPSTGSNGEKSIPSRKRKQYGETSKGNVLTNYGTDFDRQKCRAADKIGRDSFCSDKRSSTVMERRTGVDQAECSCKGKPYFLVILTENKKYQMEIPEKVVRKIGRTLSDIVALKSADAFGIISYNGNSQFCVRITDVMERLDDSRNQSNPKKRRRLSQREDDNVILLDTPAPTSQTHVDSKTNQERAQLSVPPCLDVPIQLNKNKGTKSLVLDQTRPPSLENERTPSGELLQIAKEEEESEDASDSPDASKLFHKLSWRSEGNERVAEVTKLFKCQTRHPSFAVCMRDTYLTNGYLVIPYSFAKKHHLKSIKNIMVRSSDNNVWKLGYYNRGYAASARLSAGWISLRRDLGLTDADVCVFELLKEKYTETRVFVYREIDNVLTRI
ncbi:hypothetical protein MKX01_033090 [Papaver californicum]|nr:hypothetical protein MKX01_033090 [Papaver californicum]